MTAHVEIDIETMDTTPTAVVLSVGLALFNPYEPAAPMETAYWVLDTEEQDTGGRTRSAATAQWWAEQSPEARAVLAAKGTPVRAVLHALMGIINSDEIDHVWANGPDFDCVILASLAAAYGYQWPYWKNCCHRTIKSLVLPKTYLKPLREGTHHNALDDAVYQARDLQARVKALGLRF